MTEVRQECRRLSAASPLGIAGDLTPPAWKLQLVRCSQCLQKRRHVNEGQYESEFDCAWLVGLLESNMSPGFWTCLALTVQKFSNMVDVLRLWNSRCRSFAGLGGSNWVHETVMHLSCTVLIQRWYYYVDPRKRLPNPVPIDLSIPAFRWPMGPTRLHFYFHLCRVNVCSTDRGLFIFIHLHKSKTQGRAYDIQYGVFKECIILHLALLDPPSTQ